MNITKFIGPEYVTALAFLYLTKEKTISIEKLNEYRCKVQEYFNLYDIDAVVTGCINEDGLRYFRHYFTVIDDANIVILNTGIFDDDLKYRFEYNMPLQLSECFEIVAKK